MKNRSTIDFQIPFTNKVLAVEDGLAYGLATFIPVIVILATFGLFGTTGLIVLGLAMGGYMIYSGMSLKNKDEELK